MSRSQLARPLLAALAIAGCAARPSPASAPPAAASPPTRTTFSGCLLATNEAEASRHPPPPVTRAPGPAARITAAAGGVSVEHQLTHACCLTSTVTTRLEGRTALVTERLGGAPCRCRCGSTIRTDLSLAPGTWTVVVDLEDSGGTHRVAQQDVQVE